MLFRSRLRSGRRTGVSFGGRGTFVLIALSLLLLLTSGSPISIAVRDSASSLLRVATDPIATVGRGLAAIGAVAADVQALRTRLAITLQERDEAVASAARVASLEREITELQAVLDLLLGSEFQEILKPVPLVVVNIYRQLGIRLLVVFIA
jgi:hypothetical protein